LLEANHRVTENTENHGAPCEIYAFSPCLLLLQSHNIFDFVKFILIRSKVILKKLIAIFIVLVFVSSCGSNSGKKYGRDAMTPSEDSAFQACKKSKETPNLRANYVNEILVLDSILYYDQGIRNELGVRTKVYGEQSNEVRELYGIMRYIDSVNCIKVTKILDEHGWLGINEIGSSGNTTLFLVIQHSDLQIQEKYLPMMRQAVEDGKAEASSLALLEDRVLLRQGKKQLYGSQIEYDPSTLKYLVSPIEDEPNVNKRRASVGLGPLEDYVKIWGIEYSLPKE
jgi:hypothetical protein